MRQSCRDKKSATVDIKNDKQYKYPILWKKFGKSLVFNKEKIITMTLRFWKRRLKRGIQELLRLQNSKQQNFIKIKSIFRIYKARRK